MSDFGEHNKIKYSKDWAGLIVAGTMATHEALKRKSNLAQKLELESLIACLYENEFNSFCEDGGRSSFLKMSTIINEWQPIEERGTLMSTSETEKTNTELNNLGSALVDIFSKMPETKFIVQYNSNGENIIRVVIDNINIDIVHNYNKIFLQENLKWENKDRVDFLIIDKFMYENSQFPKYASIKNCCSE